MKTKSKKPQNTKFSSVSNAIIENSPIGNPASPSRRRRELNEVGMGPGDQVGSFNSRVGLSSSSKLYGSPRSYQKKRTIEPVDYSGMEEVDE
jgi:hypothetical protein